MQRLLPARRLVSSPVELGQHVAMHGQCTGSPAYTAVSIAVTCTAAFACKVIVTLWLATAAATVTADQQPTTTAACALCM
jgi:hypothetical protein